MAECFLLYGEASIEELRGRRTELTRRLHGCADEGGTQLDLGACFAVLRGIRGVGDFFAWQILCDLLEARAFPPHLRNSPERKSKIGCAEIWAGCAACALLLWGCVLVCSASVRGVLLGL